MKENMKKGRSAAWLTAALVLTAMLSACGQDSGTAQTAAESSIAEAESSADESTEAEDSVSEESSMDDSSAADKSSSKSESSKSDSSKSSKDSSAADSKSESSAAKSSKSESSTASKSSDSKSGGSTQQSGGGQSTQGGQSAGGGQSTSGGGQTSDPDPEEEEEVINYIYLADGATKYTGGGVSVSGDTIKIGDGGSYEISGTLTNGQIFVLTDKKKVKLRLNGVSITNQSGSAINCQNAKKLTVNALAGSVNYLEDGGEHDADKGTIFSEDTVTLKGDGELNIKANYAHGVQSDDDIIVNGGNINITSAKSCLHSNDGIEINGGNLFCDGGTNGIKTDGYITITGGDSVFIGGTREEKGAIYCDGLFTVTGGSFRAIGNTCAMPDAQTSAQNVIGAVFSQQQQGGTLVNFASGSNAVLTMTSPRTFKYVVYAGDNLSSGTEYTVSYGGTSDASPEHYTYYGTYSGGTDGGSFTLDGNVFFYNVK